MLQEEQKKARKRKLKEMDSLSQLAEMIPDFPVSKQECFKGHRAGHDAFMTGFSFASFLAHKVSESGKREASWMDPLSEVRNRLCLSGKDFPLLIQKSEFAK